MVPINKSLILNSHRAKWIICKNVWKFSLKAIMLLHSYILDVQILSTNELKISSPIWLIKHIRIVLINSIHIFITYKMYIIADDIEKEISFYYPIDNRNGNKKVGLTRAYFSYSFYNVENDEKIHLKNGEMIKVKRGCYTMKDIEKVSLGKVKYDSLTGKSVIDSIIRQFSPYMNKILGMHNGNYIDTVLSKKIFSFKINKLSTTDNIFNGKPCDVLHTGYLNNLMISFTLNQRTFNIKS